MVKSNEFTASSLALAVKKATAAYDRRRGFERKNVCGDLAFEFADAKRTAGSLLDDVERMRRDAEALEESARRSARRAAVNAAIAAAVGFGTAARALRIIARWRFRDLDRRDLISLVPVVGGGVAAALDALAAINDIQEARRLLRRAEQAERSADDLGDDILRLADEYRRAGCGRDRGTS